VGGDDEALLLHGPAAAVDYLTDRTETSMTWRLKAEELHPVRDGVVVFWRETSRGSDSQEIVKETAMWFRVRDGLIVDARRYLDRARALEDAQAA
jgi:ketosteroid isomerase-like protein